MTYCETIILVFLQDAFDCARSKLCVGTPLSLWEMTEGHWFYSLSTVHFAQLSALGMLWAVSPGIFNILILKQPSGAWLFEGTL